MLGKYTHTVDPKGRLFVPSKLREELGETFYVAYGLGSYLSVYPTEKWDTIVAHYNALPLSKAGNIRFFFANAAKCEPDKQGRFLLPAELRAYAGLTDEVTFIGQGDHAEIWNAETFAAEEQKFFLNPANLKAAMEELGF